MLTLIRMAWRNLFRNARRTLITAASIGIGLAALLISVALVEGMLEQMTKQLTDDFLGQGQLHATGYMEKRDVKLTLPHGMHLMKELDTLPEISALSPRIYSFGLVASSNDSRGVRLMGVDPKRESHVTHFHKKVREGAYFEGKYHREVLIGARLAKTLKVKLGSKVVLTVAQARGGEMQQDLFKVAGIFESGERDTDSGLALVRLPELQRMLGLEDQFHEIALRLASGGGKSGVDAPIWKQLSSDTVEARHWMALEPQLAYLISFMDLAMGLMVIIVFSIVGVGIVNTILMSLFERIREFGILRALGTRPLRIGALILLEAASLAAVASVLGVLLGLLGSWYLSVYGIDWSGSSFSGVTITEPTRAVIIPEQFALFTLIIMLSTVVVAIYPALKAMAIKPVDAMRQMG